MQVPDRSGKNIYLLVSSTDVSGMYSSEAWPQISLPSSLPRDHFIKSQLPSQHHHFCSGQELTSDEGFRPHCCNADYVDELDDVHEEGRRQSQDQFQHVWSSLQGGDDRLKNLGSAEIQLSGIWGFWQGLTWPAPPLPRLTLVKLFTGCRNRVGTNKDLQLVDWSPCQFFRGPPQKLPVSENTTSKAPALP